VNVRRTVTSEKNVIHIDKKNEKYTIMTKSEHRVVCSSFFEPQIFNIFSEALKSSLAAVRQRT
jgi:predicted transcriptional regulator